MRCTLHRLLWPACLAVALLTAGTARAGAAEPLPAGVFAAVDAQTISGSTYQAVLRSQARGRFYHGQAPEAELAAFRREVGEGLIMRVLYAREAERRGLQPDEAEVSRQLAAMEQRYARTTDWEQHKERVRREVGTYLRTTARIARLEAQVRDIAPPTDAQVQAYYRGHPEQFTTPERLGVSVILRRVPPSGTDAQWQQALGEAQALAAQLAQGAAFDELARLHSQDPSADNGGDMGFLHRDMLGEAAQTAVDGLADGGITPPVRLLDGFALFRLNGRQPARLNPLGDVRERAASLWLRQAQDDAWAAFGAKLRAQARVQVNESYYAAPAPAAAGPGKPLNAKP